MKLVKESRAIINNIIETRRASTEEHDDLLDMLLKAKYEDGTSMTNTQLIDEILILFVAGHETTANALTFTLFLLANNKKELNKAINMKARGARYSNNPPKSIFILLYLSPKITHIILCD